MLPLKDFDGQLVKIKGSMGYPTLCESESVEVEPRNHYESSPREVLKGSRAVSCDSPVRFQLDHYFVLALLIHKMQLDTTHLNSFFMVFITFTADGQHLTP